MHEDIKGIKNGQLTQQKDTLAWRKRNVLNTKMDK